MNKDQDKLVNPKMNTAPELRIQLTNVEPEFALPRQFGPQLILRSKEGLPTLRINETTPVKECKFVLDAYGPRAHDDAANFLTALRVGSDCSLRFAVHDYKSAQVFPEPRSDTFIWGHGTPILTEASAKFVETHLSTFAPYYYEETYTRLGNALRLYESSLIVEEVDLALLGFMGALESMFSVANQELSFRLSLSLSKFLGENRDQQRLLFKEVRELYQIRSKIAHGDKVDALQETTAIVMNQQWVPMAEDIARRCLWKIMTLNLTARFDSRKAHEALMDGLPFCDTLSELVQG